MTSKTIIVTGASRGVGLAIAKFLLTNSHNVVIIARDEASLKDLQSQYPDQTQVLAGDMANFSLAQEALNIAIKEFGQLDGLVINHGMLPPVTNIEMSEIEAWKHNFDVNFFSAVAMVKAALPALRQSKGRIIFTSSGAAFRGYSGWGAYGSSKAALTHLAMTLASEEANLTCISIRPGVVDTQMQKELREIHASGMDEKDSAKFLTLHKEGGLLKPEQPGNVMAKLVLDGPAALNGRYLNWNDNELAEFQDQHEQ